MSDLQRSSNELRHHSCNDIREWPRDFDFSIEYSEQQEIVRPNEQVFVELNHQQASSDE
ncbi:hypothetical protein PSE10A_55800 [Pseudomonas amygdali pv. eriobotryae]|uniref:Uncharacterized protein n=1 Tax=Pseudomonas amygdali pv. eriobotryae TaxID=129137 RepID=A0A9P3AHK2_PSEA0|nr:hypothetical protein PSE10A_55800 [Pseudomonas amygdali pv. eriobotryae]